MNLSDCDIVWENTIETSQTTVPKLSMGSGLIYLYTREKTDNSKIQFGVDVNDSMLPAQAWYLAAIDYQTGNAVYKIFTGTGRFNNNGAPITIGPKGTAYVGVLNAMIAVKDN